MHAPVTNGLDDVSEVPGIDRPRKYQITTLDELRAINEFLKASTDTKDTPFITPSMEEFIADCPFFLMGTSNADGSRDVSPKGDPAGAVKVLNSRTQARHSV